MNFGRYFKLNQNMSDMVAGVTIFDYSELPAYEGLASDNPSSPKYPISLTITENAVRFKMHYCSYRCSNPNDNLDPIYGFSIDDIKHQLYTDHPSDNYKEEELNIVHIEEVILELPFAGIRANDLTEIIKKSYIASFPQIQEGGNFTGSQFLNKKIEKELLSEKHNIVSDSVSYSTSWLMDLYDNDGNINLQSKGKDELIDKFLRKLLLDFIFDLKHSNVFQTCTEYDRMYSGLMSNYYFSALVHKCEYYYYRDLTTHAIIEFEEKKVIINKSSKPKEEKNILLKKEEQRIILLYVKELVAAEDKWANDIRNPLSEELFERNFPIEYNKSPKSWYKGIIASLNKKGGRVWAEMRSLICERMTTTCWDSWFAYPEEEMRRIYFPFKTYQNKNDICNSEILVEYFYNSSDIKKKGFYPLAKESRAQSSRWFLNRYDFNDVLHLHIFKRFNFLFLLFALVSIIVLWSSGSIECLVNLLSYSQRLFSNLPFIFMGLAFLAVIAVFLFRLWYKMDTQYNYIDVVHFRYVVKKILILSVVSLTVVLFLYTIHPFVNKTYDWTDKINIGFLILFFIYLLIHGCFRIINSIKWKPAKYFVSVSVHPIMSGHLFLPKLTASIMTAWLTLSRGLERIMPFFKDYFFVIVLFCIVLGFILYQVNKSCPNNGQIAKFFKSVEFLIVSYCISLIVGLVVINYMGRAFLEKDGCLNEYHKTFVENHNSDIILYYFEKNYQNDSNLKVSNKSPIKSTNIDTAYVKLLPYKPVRSEDEPKYKKLTFVQLPLLNNKNGIIIIPRLWLMSSVLAMFIGVFLQMLFFQEKQMTDI